MVEKVSFSRSGDVKDASRVDDEEAVEDVEEDEESDEVGCFLLRDATVDWAFGSAKLMMERMMDRHDTSTWCSNTSSFFAALCSLGNTLSKSSCSK